jgi:hypothetical protein
MQILFPTKFIVLNIVLSILIIFNEFPRISHIMDYIMCELKQFYFFLYNLGFFFFFFYLVNCLGPNLEYHVGKI